MRRELLLSVVIALPAIGYAIGCGAKAETEVVATERGPYRVTCSIYHRDLAAGVTEHAREGIVFMTDAPSDRTITLPVDEIPVRAGLAPADGTDVELTIEFPRSDVQRHFRIARNEMPPYELDGFHGFTGLNYVTTPDSGVDVQFVCEASPRNEERPKPLPASGGDSPEPASPPPATPFRIRCETTATDISKTESFVLEGDADRTMALDGRSLELQMRDDPYEGRSFIVRFPNQLQQLYQFDRSAPLRDLLQGSGGLTGRTILRSTGPDAGIASVACGVAN